MNATVIPQPGERLERATVVVEDGRVTQVLTPPAGAAGDAKAPEVPGAKVVDCTGLFIYAGFVEPYAEVDAPRPDPDQKGGHWSDQVTPQRSALDGKGVDEGLASSMRKLGYTAAAIAPRGGIFRGSAAVVSLAKPSEQTSDARPPVYSRNVYQAVDFSRTRGDRSGEGRWPGYPDSLMGCIAMIRQVLADADWQASRRASGEEKGAVTAMDHLVQTGQGGATPMASPRLMFNADDELEVLRAVKIAREFGRKLVVVGNGTEFRRLDAIAEATRGGGEGREPAPLIVPLRFPEKPKVSSIGEAESLELRDLMTWEQAPTNVRRLMKAAGDLPIAITTSKSRDRGKFHENLRSAIRAGLSEERALGAITTVPAAILGLGDELGKVAPGYRANLVITDGEVFNKKTKIRDVYVDGKRHEITEAPSKMEGTFVFSASPAPGAADQSGLVLTIDKDRNVTVKQDEPKEEAKPAEAKPEEAKKDEPKKEKPKPKSAKAKNVQLLDQRLSFVIEAGDLGGEGVWTFSGLIDVDASGKPVAIAGEGLTGDGAAVKWNATRREEPKPEDKPKDDKPDAGKAGGAEGAEAKPADDQVSGTWALTAKGAEVPGGEIAFQLAIKRADDNGVTGTMTAVFGSLNVSGVFDPATNKLTLSVKPPEGEAGTIEGTVKDDTFTGTGQVGPNRADIAGTRTDKPAPGGKGGKSGGEGDDDDAEPAIPEDLPGYPFGPFALKTLPDRQHLVITNATIWTSGPQGIIENGEIEIKDGKIEYVGKSREVRIALPVVIDAKGKHVTPGIIDCHSHTGISGGVNESGMNVTTQVRIGDVTNPDAMNWYRQLAGGVTAVNNLHGSANPMGGQNQVNKVRWGCVNPDDMHFEGAIPGVKFALGENVKQSNWGERFNSRYPQTRMGVEAIIRDRFLAAREYGAAWGAYLASAGQAGAIGLPESFVKATAKFAPSAGAASPAARPRRDLQLEALCEIVAGERLIHCHSYRQDEILMLARLTAEFGFKLGSYQHILEGYKVAHEVRDSSIGASAFSDWWAFKVEVQDAIPHGGPIMHEQGVLVSYNSDSDELARRMNVEAGKAVKYSRQPDGTYSVSPEEALKFVTLNPAKQLKIDQWVGSLEAGKDADLVLWSGPPLSAFSKAEATWVDGRPLFTLEQDKAMREQNQRERARLMQKLLGAKKKSEGKPEPKDDAKPDPNKPTPPSGAHLTHNHSERVRMELVRRGVNPDDARPGVCGCED